MSPSWSHKAGEVAANVCVPPDFTPVCLVHAPAKATMIKDTVLVYRMPLPPTWQQRVFNTYWSRAG